MVIYVDLVVLSTILVNTLIILGIECIFNSHISVLRIVISNLLSVLFLGLYLLPIGSFIWIRYLVGILIGYLSFNKCKLHNKIIKIAVYYLFNISLVGVLEIFKIRNISLLILSVIFIISLGMIISFKNKDELCVKLNNKYLNALYDSGNYTFYQNIPVIYVDKKYFSNIYTLVDKLLVETINGSSFIDIYSGPMLMVANKAYHVYYAFSNINGFDLILHKDIGGIRCLNY